MVIVDDEERRMVPQIAGALRVGAAWAQLLRCLQVFGDTAPWKVWRGVGTSSTMLRHAIVGAPCI